MRKQQATWILGALVIALGGVPAKADWTCYGGNPEHHFVSNEKLPAPLSVLWKHATGVYARRGNRGGAVIAGDQVYFASFNKLYCCDLDSGEMKWVMPEGDTNDTKIPVITATPVVKDERVFVPDGSGRITAYSVDDGTSAWSFLAGGSVRTSPIIVGNFLFFGSDDDFIYCVDARNGNLVWKSNQGVNKDLQLSDDAVGSPVYYNGLIYVTSMDLKLWAFQADTGRLSWVQRLPAPSLDISPVAHQGAIYLAAGSTVYKFRLRGGNYRAFVLQQYVENDISTTPIITEKYWYVCDRSGYFYAFTPFGKPALLPNGDPWKIRLDGKAQGVPLLVGQTVYVTTDKGFIYAFDKDTGKSTWVYRTEAPRGIDPLLSYYPIRAPLAASDGKLFIVGDDGTLTCMSPGALDDEGPTIVSPRPSRGALINGFPPVYISAYLWDEGSGINPDTIELLIDGVPVEPSPSKYDERVSSAKKRDGWIYNPVRRVLTFATIKPEKGQPEQPLSNSPHRIAIQAADWKGNPAVLEWTFTVDSNVVPRGAIAVRPTSASRRGQGQQGGPGGYPGGAGDTGDSGAGGPGGLGFSGPGGAGGPGMGGPGMGGPGSGGNQQGQFRNRFGGYQYQNRGRGGYGNQRGGMGGFGGFGNRGGGGMGGFGGRGGFGGGYGS